MSLAEQEIVAQIQAFGGDLRGDPQAIANLLDALSKSLEDSDADFETHDDSDDASCEAWESLREQLKGIANTLRHAAEYYI